jgi:hypothetical protein
MRAVLLVIGLACALYLSLPFISKGIDSYINDRIDEHMAGIMLNFPPPAEKTGPMLDGYDVNRQPSP